MNGLTSLKDAILEAVERADWTDDEKDLAREAAADCAALLIQAAQGEDVEDEVAQLEAQLLNIGAAAASTGAQIFLEATSAYFRKLLLLIPS